MNIPSFFAGPIAAFNQFMESRDQKQRTMIVVALFGMLLAADYFILVRPVIHVFTKTTPELSAQKAKLKQIREDLGKKEVLESQRKTALEKVDQAEKRFIPQNELPSLLEQLSKLAQNSKVRIMSLKPSDTSDAGMEYLRVPIQISAVGGTHEFGRFLSQLEKGAIFFKVLDVQIIGGMGEDRRHRAEILIETYTKR